MHLGQFFPKSHLLAMISTVAVITPLMAFSTIEQDSKRIEVTLASPMSSSSTMSPRHHGEVSLQPAPGLTAQEISSDIAEAALEMDQSEEFAPAATQYLDDKLSWTSLVVGNGDTLSVLFKKAGYDDALMYRVTEATRSKGDSLAKIYPGQTISFGTDTKGLRQIRVDQTELEALVIDFTESGIESTKAVREPEAHVAFASGVIDSSLFLAGKRAGLPTTMVMDLANIFAWDIDFALDIQEGDSFALTYEELYLDGRKIGHGRILAASFTNEGREYKAVYYKDREGDGNYYTPKGESMRKAFIRTPVDFARISSHFNLSRKHPILHRIRAHKGTDYAASTGTPIKATGNGKVIHAGNKGGYGRTVVVQHGQGITTLYAHMNKYAGGIRVGSKVRQGQVIGYVGASGLASGPHLHYEFRVNGAHKNPLTVPLPKTIPIEKSEVARFKEQTSVLMAQLDTFSSSMKVALAP